MTQMLLLPFYLWVFIGQEAWVFIGQEAAEIVEVGPFLEAFLVLIVVPLVIAIILQLLAKKSVVSHKIIQFSAWLPVPFMALTLFVVVASQIGKL